ncbi:MAG TPA: hypothetical protein VKX25_18535 [Bryobacteraceae bacterium]|nr:hypothetical protein [Bryobacteraceae bacterium]
MRIKRSGPEALTPQFVMASLAQYVYFSPDRFGPNESQPPQGMSAASGSPAMPHPAQDASPGELRKGLTQAQVEQLFGPPIDSHDVTEGSLSKTVATYQNAKETLKAQFVNGVLVEYTTSSR